MTGLEHFRAAEQLIQPRNARSGSSRSEMLTEALVHTGLALVSVLVMAMADETPQQMEAWIQEVTGNDGS